jgi:pimeloyl-ACP methyl ester carboxylesterase
MAHWLNKLNLPLPGSTVTAAEAVQCCQAAGFDRLGDKLRKFPSDKSFKFDGCSHWFQRWRGKKIWRACFFHDLRYWVGGSSTDRLIADAKLMIDVAELLDDPTMAEIMFAGVRAGGGSAWKQEFSWGFGHESQADD